MDCNNFYASCEKVFDPSLAGRPVVVLSNNDGCIVARCALAKARGVPGGVPEFKHRAALAAMGAAVLSSNYALYGDMSARVMATAGALVPSMEVYSIDEAFLDLTGLPDPQYIVRQVSRTVARDTGIPVSIGVGPTKTLAKVANRLAKNNPQPDGVLVLPDSPQAREPYLAALDVEDVWGVGRRHGARLKRQGVATALDFMRLPRDQVRKRMTVVGLHTWLELHGTPCLGMERGPVPKKSIVSSRSFGRPVTRLDELEEAVAYHASRAGARLRAQNGVAGSLLVYLQTNTFLENQPQYCAADTQALTPTTSHTPRLAATAIRVLGRLFRPGYRYKKVGVMLSALEPVGSTQLSLLPDPAGQAGERFMAVLDAVNAKWGRDTLTCAAAGLARPWRMRQEKRSPRYTTRWEELPVARAEEGGE
ncbi:Y-family DNA polymerase [Fundidesulfovibrio butyratiphilus]